ncbi:MAG TPA: hypothetical protein VEY92_11975 [Pseudoxanthomonas sp.]|nr:hypothetical protein [Pseudoxanthomonas sp.]
MDRFGFGVHVLGVLALELSGGGAPVRPALPPEPAGILAQRLARDLAQWVPEAASLDLCLAAAHFDPAEALRPGWPLHRRLHELHARAPGAGPRVIAFGADANGTVPQPFRADAQLQGGQLRVLPFLLSGARAEAVGAQLEEMLLERGMVGADTALLAQEAFGARIEHARALTVHDLAALIAMQYQHQGLAPLWQVIETALLAPNDEHWLDAPPEPLLRYCQGQVRIALMEPAAWRLRHDLGEADSVQLGRGYDYFQARQRQMAAVLEAHGIPVTFAYCSARDDARATLQE